MNSDYIRCGTCGTSFLADYVQTFPDRTVMLGRCRRCETDAAVTIPRLAS